MLAANSQVVWGKQTFLCTALYCNSVVSKLKKRKPNNVPLATVWGMDCRVAGVKA